MENKLKLCFFGLNQLFYVTNETLNYKDLYNNIFKCHSVSDFETFKLSTNHHIESFHSHLKENNQIQYLPMNNFSELLKDYEFIIYNKDQSNLLIDKIILTNNSELNEYKTFDFQFMTQEDLILKIEGCVMKNYIILNDSVETLSLFRSLGCWTILITNNVFSYYDLEENSHISNLINSNIEYIRKNGKPFELTTYNFYQQHFYYKQFKLINENESGSKANFELLKKYIYDKKPIKTNLFTQCLKKFEGFKKKQKFYISNESVLYLPHIGGDDLSINGEIDIILTKVIEARDYEIYKRYFDKFYEHSEKTNCLRINDFENFKYFVRKDIMHHFMEKFLNLQEIKELNKIHNTNISLPKSVIVDSIDIKTREGFMKIIHDNNFKFPILVKYQSNISFFFKHLATMIFDEKHLDEYLIYYNSLNLNDLNCIIQSFVNHGGTVMKMYRICKENYIDLRSSLPDINSEFNKNFPEGFWTFKTSSLETDSYKTLLKKFHESNIIEKKIDNEYLNAITNVFEKFSGLSLFGMDYLYDYESGEYYLIDVNAFPAYKIKGMDIPEKIREHIRMYHENKN